MADLFSYKSNYYLNQWELLYGTSSTVDAKKKEEEEKKKCASKTIFAAKPLGANGKLTPEGNLPLAETPKPLTSPAIERQTPKQNYKKRTMLEAMKVMYPKLNWAGMSEDEKAQKIAEHVSSIDAKEFDYLATKDQPDGRIVWLEKFLNDENTSEEEAIVGAKALKYLKDKELQAKGVENAFSDRVKHQETSQLQVVEDMSQYEEEAQRTAVRGSAHSRFDSVKVAGSKRASELKEPVQEYAVSEYLEGSKTSSQDVQITIGKNLVDQYGKFAKNVELNIHTRISASELSEIVEYAGSNIYNLDKTHQAAAVKVTVATGNEAAIKAAASQYTKYDQSAQAEIKSTIQYTNYQSAKDAITKAELVQSTQTTSNTTDCITKTSSVDAKIEAIRESIKNQDSAAIQRQINMMTQTETIALLKRCPSKSIIMAILNSNPSMAVLSQIGEVLTEDELADYKMIMPQLCFVGSQVQSRVIRESSSNNSLNEIDRKMLTASAKIEYDKALEKQKKENA